MLRFISAGESHGPVLTAIIEGLPAGILIEPGFIDRELRRRQAGHGRGGRMKIERDHAEITSGVRRGRTTGAPVGLAVPNRDHRNWLGIMGPDADPVARKVTRPRPGHADLSGALKYGHEDIRDVIERASARETTVRVASGAVMKLMLKKFGIRFLSHTVAVGGIAIRNRRLTPAAAERTPLRCLDPAAERTMMERIDRCSRRGDSLGGVTEVMATGVCAGLGSCVHFDRRLDALIAMAMMSIPSVKGVEIGSAFKNAALTGHRVHDEIHYRKKEGFYRPTNRCGGIEGGMTNGEPVIVRLAVKPIPSIRMGIRSVDIHTRSRTYGHRERADVCVVPAVGVIAEAMLAQVIAAAFLDKFGNDCMDDIMAGHRRYARRIKNA